MLPRIIPREHFVVSGLLADESEAANDRPLVQAKPVMGVGHRAALKIVSPAGCFDVSEN
jgi:hypothetical protein